MRNEPQRDNLAKHEKPLAKLFFKSTIVHSDITNVGVRKLTPTYEIQPADLHHRLLLKMPLNPAKHIGNTVDRARW